MSNPRPRNLTIVLWLGLAAALAGSPATKFDLRSEMPAAEFARAGLEKLTPAELRALEEWLAKHFASTPQARGFSVGGRTDGEADTLVAFNTSSRKYHCPSCRHARQCTKNCLEIPSSQAHARGGVPCAVCGGTCRP